jgi:hypothetical protein
VLVLCPVGNVHRTRALHELALVVERRFEQWSSIDDLDECKRCYRAAVSLCFEKHSERKIYPNSLTLVFNYRFNHQGHVFVGKKRCVRALLDTKPVISHWAN